MVVTLLHVGLVKSRTKDLGCPRLPAKNYAHVDGRNKVACFFATRDFSGMVIVTRVLLEALYLLARSLRNNYSNYIGYHVTRLNDR